MTVQYKTPGVYVQELDAFPPSIVGVETAVPVFIGYTRTAEKAGRPMKLRPLRISSMVEYVAVFGDAPTYQFALTAVPAAKAGPAAASAGPPAAQGGDAAAKVQVADNSADSKTHDAAPNDPNAPKDETKASTAADPPHQGEQGGSTDAKPDDHTAAPENQAAAKTDPAGPRGESFCLMGEGEEHCGFTSYAQCQASASGLGADCTIDLSADDRVRLMPARG